MQEPDLSERVGRIEARMEEQDRAQDKADREREKAAQVTADAVQAALESSEKLNEQRVGAERQAREGLRREMELITQASQRAIGKAEEAQSEVNKKSNEFRGQLADQAERLYPRAEAEVLQRETERRMRILEGSESKGKGGADLADKLWAVLATLAAVALAVVLILHGGQ
jgi:hypothetical protein